MPVEQSVLYFRSDGVPWEFMPNGAPPGSVTAHESKPECCMIKPLQGHDLLSFLKLLLTVLEALPPSGLAPLSPGSVCRCLTVRPQAISYGPCSSRETLCVGDNLQTHTSANLLMEIKQQ